MLFEIWHLFLGDGQHNKVIGQQLRTKDARHIFFSSGIK